MLTKYDKAIIALIMAVLGLLNTWFDRILPITEGQITVLVSLLTPLLVYAIPNKKTP